MKKFIKNFPKIVKVFTMEYIPARCMHIWYWSIRQYYKFKYNWNGQYDTRPEKVKEFDDNYWFEIEDRLYFIWEDIRKLSHINMDDLGHEMLNKMYKLAEPSINMTEEINRLNKKYNGDVPEDKKMSYENYYLPNEICDKIYNEYKKKAEKIEPNTRISPLAGYFMSSPNGNIHSVRTSIGKDIHYDYNRIKKYVDKIVSIDELVNIFKTLNDVTIHMSETIAKQLNEKYNLNIEINKSGFDPNAIIFNNLKVFINNGDDPENPIVSINRFSGTLYYVD